MITHESMIQSIDQSTTDMVINILDDGANVLMWY